MELPLCVCVCVSVCVCVCVSVCVCVWRGRVDDEGSSRYHTVLHTVHMRVHLFIFNMLAFIRSSLYLGLLDVLCSLNIRVSRSMVKITFSPAVKSN